MSWTQATTVAAREIRVRARTKAFRVITGLLVLVTIAGPTAAALWPEGDDDLRRVTVGLVDVDDATAEQIAAFAATRLDLTFRPYAASARADLDRDLSDGEIDVALETGPTLVWDRAADPQIAAVLHGALQQLDALSRGRELGLGDDEIARMLTPVEVGERHAQPSNQPRGLAMAVAMIGLMAAFLLPQLYGQLTMMSVVEEKSTRVIEVLLSHLRPRTLLMGKVVGIGALAVAQLAVVICGLVTALLVTDAIDVPGAVWRFVPVIVIAIVGGLAIYNTLFALLGSLISRQEDASQVILPVFIPLMAGFFIAQAAIAGSANPTLVRVLTLFPLTAPMLLPIRVALETIEPWEIALSLGLLTLGVWLLIRIAGRVYEFTLLHTGSRVGWGQLLRLSRGSAID
jgi:ABC-2 type transport system permease protein